MTRNELMNDEEEDNYNDIIQINNTEKKSLKEARNENEEKNDLKYSENANNMNNNVLYVNVHPKRNKERKIEAINLNKDTSVLHINNRSSDRPIKKKAKEDEENEEEKE